MPLSFYSYIVMAGVVIALVFLYRYADRRIKTLNPSTVKKVNWAGFILAILGGVAWYLFHNGIYMLVTLAGVIVYFLFYGYDKMEEKKDEK